MKRLCFTIACLSAVVWTQASADNLFHDPPKTPRPHAAKAKHIAAAKPASLDQAVRFSDPYAPPEGTTVVRKSSSGIPGYSYPVPKDPQGGLSISMGQDGGGHTTGGLSWGF